MTFYDKYFIKKQLKAYVISLEQPELLFNNLEKQNFNPILVKAVDANKLTNKLKSKYANKFFATFGTNKTIAIAMSHIKAWKKIVDSGDPYGIVLEDDVILTDDFYDKVMTHLRKLPKGYDIFYLGCFGCQNNLNPLNILLHTLGLGNFNFKKINEYVNRPSVALATHAYIVSRSGAKKLIKELEGKIYFHIDFCLQLLAIDNKIKVYSPSNRIVYQKSTDKINTENSHPLLLNKMLSNFYIDEKVRLSYITTVPLLKYDKLTLTVSSLLFIILGIGLGRADYNFLDIALFFVILSLPDYKNIENVKLHYILFIIGFIIGRKSNDSTK